MRHGNGPTAPAGRRIYLKGIGGQAAGPFSLPQWRSPPRSVRKTPTFAQLCSQNTLKVAAAFLHEITAFEYDQCKEIAGASGYTWKDQFYAMLYGTGVEFTDVNGVKWQGRRILAAEIQQLLDSISSAEGGILVRTPTGWASLLPSTPGYVLTLPTGGTGIPEWLAPSGGSGPSVAATTLNPADTDTFLLLDPDNLTIRSTNFLHGGSRTIKARGTGKFYYEANVFKVSGNNDGVGWSNMTGNRGDIAAGRNGLCIADGGNVYMNGSFLYSIGSIQGHTVRCAIDLDTMHAWQAVDLGRWNNSDTADPVADVGAANLSTFITPGTLMAPAFSSYDSNTWVTFNFGQEAMRWPVPYGYTAGWPAA